MNAAVSDLLPHSVSCNENEKLATIAYLRAHNVNMDILDLSC